MNEYKNKIENLINSYDKFSDLEFRLLLEEILKRGGRDAEEEYAILLKNKKYSLGVRLNIIRVAGYIKSPLFLIPLKTIIDTETNINLRKEAIIAISKYNDKKALNILSDSLKKNRDKTLENIIKQEIGKIKQDNPVLSLVPRFLKSTDNKKAYTTILNVLCKIVTPSDSKIFIPYLNSEDKYIAEGSFKIICYTGDKSISNFILSFFEKSIKYIDCLTRIKCDKLYEIITILIKYITNNPETFELFYEKTKELYEKTADIRVKEQIIQALILGGKEKDISRIFDKENNLKKFIIENFKDREDGVNFLTEKLKESDDYSEDIIKILITTAKGRKYLAENYKSFDNKEKGLILNNLSSDNYNEFKALVKDSLLSENPLIIKTALTKIKENYDYSVENYLFDKKTRDKLRGIQELYIDTIISLFPGKAFVFIFNSIINNTMSLKKLENHIQKLGILLSKNPIIILPKEKKDMIMEFSNIILRTNNSKLITESLRSFKHLNTIEPESFSILNEVLEYYVGKRKNKFNSDEKKELKKFIDNLKTNKELINRIKEGEIKLRKFFDSENGGIDTLFDIITHNKLSFFVYRKRIIEKLKNFLISNNFDLINRTLDFLLKVPNIAFVLRKEIEELQKTDSFSIKANSKELLSLIPESLKIIIKFSEKANYPIFRDQFKFLFYEYEITDNGKPEKGDILITDSRSLMENRGIELSEIKPIIILNKLSDGAMIKKFGGITFLPEFSLYRIIIQIIKEIW